MIDESYIKKVSFFELEKKDYKYFAFEGIDGAGKTTISQKIVNELKNRGIMAEHVYEPYTEEIKNILTKYPDMNPAVEAMLFAADRLLMHTELLSKLLRENYVVIGDRCFVASLVYQVIRGASEEWVYSLNYYAIRPTLIIFLDVTPETAVRRLEKKSLKQLSHLEKLEYLESLRNRYLEVLKKLDNVRYVILDANMDEMSVFKNALDIIMYELV